MKDLSMSWSELYLWLVQTRGRNTAVGAGLTGRLTALRKEERRERFVVTRAGSSVSVLVPASRPRPAGHGQPKGRRAITTHAASPPVPGALMPSLCQQPEYLWDTKRRLLRGGWEPCFGTPGGASFPAKHIPGPDGT